MTDEECVRAIMEILEHRPVRYTVEELRSFVAQRRVGPRRRAPPGRGFDKARVYSKDEKVFVPRLARAFEHYVNPPMGPVITLYDAFTGE